MLMMPRSCLQFQLETARSAAHGSTTLEPGGDHCATCAAEFQRSVVGNFVSEPWVEVQRDYLFRELPLLQDPFFLWTESVSGFLKLSLQCGHENVCPS